MRKKHSLRIYRGRECGKLAVKLQLNQMVHGEHFRAAILRDHGATGAMDPVLGVDHAYMAGPTFPPHPHAGFSAVSYVFADAETGLSNRDSIGTSNLIRPGALHWTAAGQGIVHEEVPIDGGKTVHLLQIFINLPAAKRHAPPFAISLEAEDVPEIERDGVLIRVPLGAFDTVRSPLKTPTQLTLLDIRLEAKASTTVPIPENANCFVLPILGAVKVNDEIYDADGSLIPGFSAVPAGQAIILEAQSSRAQIALFSGLPIALQN
jgi:redox-sensitive bicupin YhaK (pirin superfamily)